jgi:hypothetical protein
VQFHEDPALLSWWTARVAPVVGRLDAARRRRLLSLAALAFAVERMDDRSDGPAWAVWLGAPILVGLCWGVWRVAIELRRMPLAVRTRPQIFLHAVLALGLVAFWTAPAGPARRLLAAIVPMLPFLVWRLGYLLKTGQRGKLTGTKLADHLFYMFPAWGGTNTPYGKGFDYLTGIEARTAEAFARAQLAGVRLILLGLVWRGVVEIMAAAVYADPKSPLTRVLGGWTLGVPRLPDLVPHPASAPLGVVWCSLYLELVWVTLRLAAKGHVIIGMLRLFGFNAFRNTYKPLLAESVVEFWNRYYYYFKEMLAEFFFFPTFVRRFRHHPRLRIAAATFAAAFAGNMYYHTIEQPAFLSRSPAGTWAVVHSRLLYCFLLACGITVSMLREQQRRGRVDAPAGGAAGRLRRIAGVWTFFALIHVWALPGRDPDIFDRTRFFLSLFGL